MIVPMKKVQIVVLKEDKHRVMLALQKHGEVMIVEDAELSKRLDTTNDDALLKRANEVLKDLKKYQEKPKFVRDLVVVDYEKFIGNRKIQEDLLEEIEKTNQRIAILEQDNKALQEQIDYYAPWIDLLVPLDEIKNTRHATVHTGFVEPRDYNNLINLLGLYGSPYQSLGRSTIGQSIFFANYFLDDASINEELRTLGFQEVNLPKLPQRAVEIIEENNLILGENGEEIARLKEDLIEFARMREQIELLSDQLASDIARKEAPLILTDAAVYFEGWVRNDRIEMVDAILKDTTDVYDFNYRDPEEDEMPPTKTENNAFVAPFEIITNMFAQPNPYEVDPNPMMSFWYWIIFGMMMGDAGYGLVMVLVFYLFIKIKKPRGDSVKLFQILMYTGITTIIWGVLFGSYFGYGFEPFGLKAVLVPIDDPMTMLLLSIVIGAVHIICGLLVKMYDNIRKKQYMAIISDQLGWIFIILGIGFLFIPGISKVGIVLMIVGAAAIVLFAGRANKNPVKRIGSGLYSLYNISGFMSDILSYSRILALSLSSAVIAMVMNTLAEMVRGDLSSFALMTIIRVLFAIIVYFIGHIFNLVMGMLSAYVHASRLQYIEFFGKFYEGDGYEFQPLSLQLKYIDKINVDNSF